MRQRRLGEEGVGGEGTEDELKKAKQHGQQQQNTSWTVTQQTKHEYHAMTKCRLEFTITIYRVSTSVLPFQYFL